MEDFLLREYLRNRHQGISEEGFMKKMKEFLGSEEPMMNMRRRRDQGIEEFLKEYTEKYNRERSYNRERERGEEGDYFNRYREANRYREQGGGSLSYRQRELMEKFFEELEYMGHEEKKKLMEMLLGGGENGHFDEDQAEYIVSRMYHTEGGKKYMGEKYSIEKAKEVWGKYKSFLSKSVTPADIYVAINASYHDYCELFKEWFGENIDSKVIEAAINFWFKDDDWKGGSKVWKYFKEA